MTSPEGAARHKQKQLELASKMTGLGLWGSDTKCRICGGTRHGTWNCPERTGAAWAPAQIQCNICGEVSHVTEDCKYYDKKTGKAKEGVVINGHIGHVANMEEEYNSFIADLTGEAPNSSNRIMGAITAPLTSNNLNSLNNELNNFNTNNNNSVNSMINNNNSNRMIQSSASVFGKNGITTINNNNTNTNTNNTNKNNESGRVGTGVDYHNVPPPCQAGAKAPNTTTLPMPTFDPKRLNINTRNNNNNSNNNNSNQHSPRSSNNFNNNNNNNHNNSNVNYSSGMYPTPYTQTQQPQQPQQQQQGQQFQQQQYGIAPYGMMSPWMGAYGYGFNTGAAMMQAAYGYNKISIYIT